MYITLQNMTAQDKYISVVLLYTYYTTTVDGGNLAPLLEQRFLTAPYPLLNIGIERLQKQNCSNDGNLAPPHTEQESMLKRGCEDVSSRRRRCLLCRWCKISSIHRIGIERLQKQNCSNDGNLAPHHTEQESMLKRGCGDVSPRRRRCLLCRWCKISSIHRITGLGVLLSYNPYKPSNKSSYPSY